MPGIKPRLSALLSDTHTSPQQRLLARNGDSRMSKNEFASIDNETEYRIAVVTLKINEIFRGLAAPEKAGDVLLRIVNHTVRAGMSSQERYLASQAVKQSSRALKIDTLYQNDYQTVLPADIQSYFKPANRRPRRMYPISIFTSFRIDIRKNLEVNTKHLLMGVAIDSAGLKSVLGAVVTEGVSTEHWVSFFDQLKTAGLDDILIASVPNQEAPRALLSVFPRAAIQIDFKSLFEKAESVVDEQDMDSVDFDLRKIYSSVDEKAALGALESLSEKWDEKYLSISTMIEDDWPYFSNQFCIPDDIRQILSKNNILSAIDQSVRKALKRHRYSSAHDQAVDDALESILRIAKEWKAPIRSWKSIRNRLIASYGDRMTDCINE